MIKKLIAITFASLFIAGPASAATTVNVPFLTWENGKTQSIVLGGPGSNGAWKMQLEGGDIKPLVFKQSAKSTDGSYTYTLDVPKNLVPGGYVVQAVETDGTKTVVAGVQIKARETYRIAEIPTDLRLLALIFAGITAIFTVVRSRRYANLSFDRRQVESNSFIYKFRNTRLASEGNSVSRYVALHSGEPLHRISPMLWSILPWLAIPLGIFTAIKIQFDAAIPNGPVALFMICAALGALDATTGITLALSLGFMHVGLGNVTNVRGLVVAVTFSLAWYFPAMIASLVKLTIGNDFKKFSDSASRLLSSLVAALVGGVSVVMATILTDSLVINRQASDILRWPMAALVAAVIFVKFVAADSIKTAAVAEEKLFIARVVSPGLATTLFFGTLLLVYVWTNQFGATLLSAVVISAPYFLLFVVFPQWGRFITGEVKRNILIEALIVVSLTFGIYLLIQLLPLAVISKSRAFILLGLVPSFIHALYSVVVASGEFAARKAEMEAKS